MRWVCYAKILGNCRFIRQQIFQNACKVLFIKVAGVAQLAEHLICNQEVGGSNPSSGTNLLAGIDYRRSTYPYSRLGFGGLSLIVFTGTSMILILQRLFGIVL